MAYDDFGKGSVVVLLHGYPFDRSMWREQIEVLRANGFRAIAPELRGRARCEMNYMTRADPG